MLNKETSAILDATASFIESINKGKRIHPDQPVRPSTLKRMAQSMREEVGNG